MKSETIILCEGYYDRAFWDGWLRFMDCVEERTDPWRKAVRGGEYGYTTPSGREPRFVRLTPCQGKDNVLPWARQRLAGRQVEPVAALIVCVDRDDGADGSPAPEGAVTEAAVEELVRKVDSEYESPRSGEYLIDEGTTGIVYLPWWTPDPPAAEVPHQQTLERLVCAALAEVYPQRARAVATWLAGRPDPPKLDSKDHAWSYLAGWYAPLGCEAFFKCLWDDPGVARELRHRLEQIGAWERAILALEPGA